METSAFQALKLAAVQGLGLSKDALHVHVGLFVFLVASLALRRNSTALKPLFIVVLVACAGEAVDMRDDLGSLGHWRWGASLHDIANTVFWPAVLAALTHLRLWPSQRRD